jgi:hypothetical protein
MGAVTLSGEQWLEQVFRPAVAAVERARSAGVVPVDSLRVLGGRLAAQVEVLGDTGVLTDEQERTALGALEKAGIMPEVRSTSASASVSGTGVAMPVAVRAGSAPVAARQPDEPPRLRGVLAGPRRLGQLDGRPVTLISAELWSDRFLVDLYTDPGPEYRDRRTRATREHLEWLRRQRRGQAVERPGAALVASPLQNLTWKLQDEHGTEYHRTGGSAEAEHHLDRQRMRWSPAPPVHTEHLTLLATDATGAVVLNAEIPVPGRTT